MILIIAIAAFSLAKTSGKTEKYFEVKKGKFEAVIECLWIRFREVRLVFQIPKKQAHVGRCGAPPVRANIQRYGGKALHCKRILPYVVVLDPGIRHAVALDGRCSPVIIQRVVYNVGPGIVAANNAALPIETDETVGNVRSPVVYVQGSIRV